MSTIDWIFVVIPLLIVFAVGTYTQRYMKSVSDFLSGGRLAGRYLLAVSRGEMQAGAVVFVAAFEVISKSGFTLNWWNWIGVPVGVLVGISGFVIYRYRETRAMTLAQFFEIRYSKSFRLFTGLLGFFAGMLNFGIIPAVGSRFFVYFLGLPPTITLFSFSIPTYIPLMGLLLTVTLLIATSGGLLTVMMTDCIEGIISQVLYLVIIFALISMFSWAQITDVLGNQQPGHSLLNPFDSSGLKDFNIYYVLMGLFVGVYGTMAWQNSGSYNSAASSPHESRMAGILGFWRGMGKGAVVVLLAVCAMTYLSHPDFTAQSLTVHQEISGISNPQIQQQMTIPIALSHLLPAGVKGALCVILLMGVFGGDSTHLHSWGGLFIQDVLVPLRKTPFGPKQHVRLLRLSMAGVAIFAFIFGSLFQQTEYIMMWWSVTMAVFVGGAGSAIIGGLYWKKGTTAGAWAGLIAGSGLSLGGIVARQPLCGQALQWGNDLLSMSGFDTHRWIEFLLDHVGNNFPLNGVEISFFATLTAILLYAVVSLLTHKEDFNMDRMLHRGLYATVSQAGVENRQDVQPVRRGWIRRLAGVDECFSRGDKWIAGLLLGWSLFWFTVFIAGSIWNLLAPWPESVWASYWHVVGIGIPIIFALITAVWFTWGGLRDIRALFRRLREQKINHLDDGTVINHQNLDETALGPGPEQPSAKNMS